MGSSPTPEPLVDAGDLGEPSDVNAGNDMPAIRAGRATSEPSTRTSTPTGGPATAPPRHSPVVLVIDVVRMLRGRGLGIIESLAYSGEAVSASAELLRRIGIEPDHFAPRHPEADGPALAAAATLMRAAGIEPNYVVVWPGRQS